MIKIDELIDKYNLHDKCGKDIDFILKIMLFTLIDISRGHKVVFEMMTKNPYLWQKLALDSDSFFEKENFLIAEYLPSDDYPYYRVYVYCYKEQNALSLESFSYILNKEIKTISNESLYYKYNSSELIEKFTNWVNHLKKKLAPLINMANGRIDNTKIDQVIVLHGQPSGCIVCGKDASGYISTVLMDDKAIFIIANICNEHQEMAKEHPNFLNFFSTLFRMGIDLSSMKMTQKPTKEIISLISKEIESELECCLLKNRYDELKEEYSLTFERSSKIKIILRLHTFMDYAYMIDKANRKPFQRIDSAPDHKELEFFPDHLHKTIKKGKKPDVESSYTFGLPLLDLPSIKKMILNLEKEL